MKIIHLILFFAFISLHYKSSGQVSLYDQKYPTEDFFLAENKLSPQEDSIKKNDSLYNYLADYLAKNHSSKNVLDSYSGVLNELEGLNPRIIFLEKLKFLRSNTPNISEIDSSFIKSRYSEFKEEINFEGDIMIESFTSNQVMPFSLNESEYVRLYAQPKLSILTLPFEAEFFYTTEDNSYYNTNFFTFRFDPYTFSENLLNASKKKAISHADKIKDISSQKELVSRYGQDLKRLQRLNKEQLSNQRSILSKQLDKAKMLGEDKIDSIRQIDIESQLKDSLVKTKVAENIVEVKDSALDSVNNELFILMDKYETLLEYQSKLNQYVSIVDSVNQELSKLEELYDKVKNYNNLKTDLNEQLGDSLNRFVEKGKDFLSTIEEFDIGLINPFYSKSTLNALPIKGFNFKQAFKNSKMFYKVTLGRTPRGFSSFSLEDRNSTFDRNVVASQLGFGSEFGNHISFTSVNFWDPNFTGDYIGQTQQSNTVNGIKGSQLVDKVTVDFELLASNSKIKINQNSEPIGLANFDIRNQLSVFTSLSYKPNNKNVLKFKIDQKGGNFQSLGSPFIRNDYRMLDLSSSHRILNNKFIATSYYKYFTDNLSGLNDQDNVMKGFGITGQSNFKKIPNIMIAYSPFEQGNSHRDTFLRTNNSFKTLTSMISYHKAIKKHYLSSVLTYTLSVIEYMEGDGQLTETRFMAFNQMYKNHKVQCNLGFLASRTNPSIDSLSFNSINLNCNYLFKKGSVGLNVQQKYTLAGGKYMMHKGVVSYPITKGVQISAEGGIGYIDKIWGLESQNIWNAIFRMEFKL